MACLKLGSKSEAFHIDGNAWLCSTGLPSDVIIEIGGTSFHLHKFPLISRSEVLETLMRESSNYNDNDDDDDEKSVLQLDDIPGGAKAFLLVAKFCYDVKMELTASNVVTLRCAAEYLRMTEDYGEGNLITQTENFLNHNIFSFWSDTIKALKTCEEVLPHSEELHIVSHCIQSLVLKACADPEETSQMWNGIIITSSKSAILGEDWWFSDISSLSLPLYKRFILGVKARHMKPQRISASLVHYANMHLHNGNYVESDQRTLLEEIVELLPNDHQKGIIPTKFLLRLLRISMACNASSSCCANLEKRIGVQLDDADLEDILIPNMGYSVVETLYDVECVQRMVDHFITMEHDVINPTSNYVEDERKLIIGGNNLVKVANLVDGYLAEVAPDVNMKSSKFLALASLVPDYARTMDDGVYRAIDIYLKAHPGLTDSEKEQICRLINCQKLSLEASTHAAQNERLPLRTIVQILFFEQLRLRTSVAGWLFASDDLENLHDISGNLALVGHDGNTIPHVLTFGDMKERVSELEKECLSMKHELEKMVKTKVSWNVILKKLSSLLISKPSNNKTCTKSKISASQMEEDKAMTMMMNRKIDI